jgi:hypothetical protein
MLSIYGLTSEDPKMFPTLFRRRPVFVVIVLLTNGNTEFW